MKKLSFILTLLFLTSCFSTETNHQEKVVGRKIQIMEYDGCEYLVAIVGNRGFLTHKGNCKYCTIRNYRKR